MSHARSGNSYNNKYIYICMYVYNKKKIKNHKIEKVKSKIKHQHIV